MSFCLITPTRGDRPVFKDQYWNIIKSQTKQPDEVIVVDYEPKSKDKDLTQRYKYGIEKATENGHEYALLWEDDDWYHPKYIEWIIKAWEDDSKPDVFGAYETYYYNIFTKKMQHMRHPGRASAFCSLLKLPYKINYPKDNDPWFDIHIFRSKNNQTKGGLYFPTNEVLAIGIKHGIGLSGGSGHNYIHPKFVKEKSFEWFNKHCLDKDFYNSLRNT